MITSEYISDSRQLQVRGTLLQLLYGAEENITDVRKGLKTLVYMIAGWSPHFHPEFHTDLHQINYLTGDLAEFSDWSLGAI